MTRTAQMSTGGRPITRSVTRAAVSSSTTENQTVVGSQSNLTDTARPKRGRKPKNVTNQSVRTTQIQEATTSTNQPLLEEAAGSGSTSNQQIPIVSRPKRGRKPKSTLPVETSAGTETETPEKNEQVVLPNEQPVDTNSGSSSTSTQQIPIVPRPKRGRKPKNTLPVETRTGTETPEQNEQVVLPNEQPVEITTAGSSQQVVTSSKSERKPNNTTAQNTKSNESTTSTTSKRGHKRKAVTEDDTTADQITGDSNVGGESSNPPKRGRKNLSEQELEARVESIETSDTSAEATTSSNRGLKRKTDIEDNNEEAEEHKDGSANPNKKLKTKKQKPRKPKKPKEKRQARVRTVCPVAIRERIYRAESQRIYMVSRTAINESKQEFVVLGSTGNVYTVTISHNPNCTCPDFLKGYLCKHIIFVYLRVLRLNKESMYIYQKALLTDELKKIFANAAPDPTVMASKRVRDKYKEFTSGETFRLDEKRRPIEGDCPICYEPLEENDQDNIVWCKDGCGNNLHKDCYVQWRKSKHGGKVTCVYCRVEWIESNYGDAVVSKEGYINLGSVQGMNLKRDTSTYYRPSRYTQGSWY